jgi:hypothetical protein
MIFSGTNSRIHHAGPPSPGSSDRAGVRGLNRIGERQIRMTGEFSYSWGGQYRHSPNPDKGSFFPSLNALAPLPF